MKGGNKIGGLARGCEPDGTADELSKRKKLEPFKVEPPGEVIAEALRIYREDRAGRWHVRAPEGAQHRDGIYAWRIRNREVERLLRLLWAELCRFAAAVGRPFVRRGRKPRIHKLASGSGSRVGS